MSSRHNMHIDERLLKSTVSFSAAFLLFLFPSDDECALATVVENVHANTP